MNGKLLAKTGMIVPRIFLGPAVSTLEGKRQGWVVGCSLGSALSLLRDPHSPRYSSVLTYLLCLLRLRGGEQVMGMESGPQTWLHIRSKVRRDCFKNKRKVLEQHPPTHTHMHTSDDQIGIFRTFQATQVILMHPLSFVKHSDSPNRFSCSS